MKMDHATIVLGVLSASSGVTGQPCGPGAAVGVGMLEINVGTAVLIFWGTGEAVRPRRLAPALHFRSTVPESWCGFGASGKAPYGGGPRARRTWQADVDDGIRMFHAAMCGNKMEPLEGVELLLNGRLGRRNPCCNLEEKLKTRWPACQRGMSGD